MILLRFRFVPILIGQIVGTSGLSKVAEYLDRPEVDVDFGLSGG